MLRALLCALMWQHVLAPLLLPMLVRKLTDEKFTTRYEFVADRSWMQYGESKRSRAAHADDPKAKPTEYSTSILGMVNGILPRFGLVLVVLTSDDLKVVVPPYLEVRERWW